MIPSSPEAFKLMMEGTKAFADIEENGVRIDVDYLDRVIKQSGIKIKQLQEELRNDEVYKAWRKRYGSKSDLNSPVQLGTILYEDLGYECKHRTKTGRPKTDEDAFEDLDIPFIRKRSSFEKLKKARNTYLADIKRETVDGFLHAFFNLFTATTYRSSCDSPNLQNQPIRDPRQAKLIRRAFIPRSKDYTILEVDQGSLEFKGAACFWQDKEMIKYASDPDLDIHRDMAAECYKLKIDDVSKKARTHAKNSFVFPILYGSYWGSCAPNLWARINQHSIETNSGVNLYDHLRQKGITELGSSEDREPPKNTYRYVVKKVEERFNKRFPHWSEEKEIWWNQYLERGWFPLLTGFVCKGIYSYNNLMNTPIQGPSFHLVLWALIELNKWLKKNKMKTKIICQVHDSIVLDVYKKEFHDVLFMCNKLMTQDVRKAMPWVVVPLEIEAEASDRSWYDKKPIPLAL